MISIVFSRCFEDFLSRGLEDLLNIIKTRNLAARTLGVECRCSRGADVTEAKMRAAPIYRHDALHSCSDDKFATDQCDLQGVPKTMIDREKS